MPEPIPYWPARPTQIWPGGRLYSTVVGNPDWAAEPKLDGWRCVVRVRRVGLVDPDLVVEAWSRHGRRLALDPGLVEAAQFLLPADMTFDAELLGPRQAGAKQRLVIFDVMQDGFSYEKRRAALAKFFLPVNSPAATDAISLVEQLPNEAGSFVTALAAGAEGLVFKRRVSHYPFGHGPDGAGTPDWLKLKAPTVDGRRV